MFIPHKNTEQKNVGPMSINEYNINSQFSGALIHIDGDHGALKNVNEDRVYFVIEGHATFIVNEEERQVSAYDMVFVTKNTPYNFKGKAKLLLICSPEFDPEDDVFLKKDK